MSSAASCEFLFLFFKATTTGVSIHNYYFCYIYYLIQNLRLEIYYLEMKEVPFLLCRWHSTGTSSPEAVQPPRWRSPKATWPWAWHLLWVCCWGRGCTWWTQRCVPASDILWSVFWLFFVVLVLHYPCVVETPSLVSEKMRCFLSLYRRC